MNQSGPASESYASALTDYLMLVYGSYLLCQGVAHLLIQIHKLNSHAASDIQQRALGNA